MQLEQETIEKILVELGYNLQDCGKYWRSNAVYRDGDNRTSLLIWKDTGSWKDFAANTKYLSFRKLIELSNPDDPKRVAEIIKSIQNNEELYFDAPKSKKLEAQEFFDSKEVETLIPHYSFYNEKSISDNTLKLHKGGFAMSGKMNGRFTFCVYDENGKIIGLTGRDLLWKEGSIRPKWKKLGKSSQWVYPVFLPSVTGKPFFEAIKARQEVILLESVGDSLALTEQGLLNHLVIFGLTLSSKQISFLVSQNLKKIYVSTNNDVDKKDNRGLLAAISIYLKLINIIDIGKVEIKLPLRKDFGDMLTEKVPIEDWVNKKIDKVKQINYILSLAEKNVLIIPPKQKKILLSYQQELNNA